MRKKLRNHLWPSLAYILKICLAILTVLLCAIVLNRTSATVRDVQIDDFSLSDDGKTITIWVSTGDRTSYPYLRSMSVKEDFGTLYLTFRPTFFGKLGAQDTFRISLQDGQTRIIVDDPNEPYNIGLFWKPESGWQTTRFRVLNSNN